MWVVRPDGSGLTELPISGQAAFAPDGHRLAFSNETKLVVTDLNGANAQALLKARNVVIGPAAWSPDGGALYFGGFDSSYTTNEPLYRVPSTGGTLRAIARRTGEHAFNPDVSVTGRVAYVSETERLLTDRVFTSDPNGDDIRLLVRGKSPSWSPDGTRIAFIADGDIRIANADGSGAATAWKRPVRDYGADDLVWSPDGGTIAFVRLQGTSGDTPAVLSVLDLATGIVRDVLNEKRVGSAGMFGVDWQSLQENDQLVLPQPPRLEPCEVLGSHTILRTGEARIYSIRGRFYGCLYRLNRRFELARQWFAAFPTMVSPQAAGPYAGFGINTSDAPGGIGEVMVYDLRNGRRKFQVPAAVLGGYWSGVDSFVMTRTGAAAWIGGGYYDPEGHRCDRGSRRVSGSCVFPEEVHKIDHTKRRLLDSGFGIRPKSLALRGRTITWTNGRTHRSARLH